MEHNEAPVRCAWVDPKNELYCAYHDAEWGTPIYGDDAMYELFLLETFQAGLSWITILKKREAFRKAFDGFNVKKIAAYGEEKIAELLQDAGIIRCRGKIRGAVENAKIVLALQEEFGSFDAYIWRFVGGEPLRNTFTQLSEIPVSSPEAEAMSKDLRKRGFSFVGPTICYAHMQATGMVNDHLVTCFRHAEV